MKLDKMFKIDINGFIYDIYNIVFYKDGEIFVELDYSDFEMQVFKDQMFKYIEIPEPKVMLEGDYSLNEIQISSFRDTSTLFIPITDETFKLIEEEQLVDENEYEKCVHDLYKVTIGSQTFNLGIFYKEIPKPKGIIYDEVQDLDDNLSTSQVDMITDYIDSNFTRNE